MVKTSMIRGAKLFLLGVGLVALCGLGSWCATTGGYASSEANVGYQKCYDLLGEYKLVGRGNDVYMEKIDGSDSRRITNTPNARKELADFSSDGKYIVYREWYDNGNYQDFRIKSDDDDSTRKPVSPSEAYYIGYKRHD